MPLEAKNLYFKFQKQESWILEDCNIRIEQGERVVILAPSGYGKTTLALLLAGYLKPDKGQILLEEKQLPKEGIYPVQLIFQHPEKAINPRWKLKKVLEEVGEIPEGLLTALGIEKPWLDRFPGELSGGELQRFCVARALMAEPGYLICDEISTMLDTITQAQIWQVILEEAEKRKLGLLIITHNRHLAEKVGSRIVELE
ncbi:MAG: ATP-binding cassette domain-containing protein [Lachnospiraceae bacterium]|nr:ATP-binding cassette domain-containing protein [Lachnospiraceae bacterium]